jgi:hypothetical protein
MRVRADSTTGRIPAQMQLREGHRVVHGALAGIVERELRSERVAIPGLLRGNLAADLYQLGAKVGGVQTGISTNSLEVVRSTKQEVMGNAASSERAGTPVLYSLHHYRKPQTALGIRHVIPDISVQ